MHHRLSTALVLALCATAALAVVSGSDFPAEPPFAAAQRAFQNSDWTCQGIDLKDSIEEDTGLTVVDLGCTQGQRLHCYVAFAEFAPVYMPLNVRCSPKHSGFRRTRLPFGAGRRLARSMTAAMTFDGPANVLNMTEEALQAAVALGVNRLLAPTGEATRLAAKDVDVVMQPSATSGQVHAVVSLYAGRAKDVRAVTCATREVLETTPARLLAALETVDAGLAGASGATTVGSRIFCLRCAFESRCPASYTSPGFFTKTVHAFDPSCSIAPGTTFVEHSRPMNQCVECGICENTERREDMMEAGCAAGNAIYSDIFPLNAGTCDASPPLWLSSNATDPDTHIVGACVEELPNIYAKYHCDSPREVVCENPAASPLSKASAVQIDFYTDNGCEAPTRGDDTRILFADGFTCSPIANPFDPSSSVYLKGTVDPACSQASAVDVTVHSDQLCTSQPIPGVSGALPLNTCIVGSPLAPSGATMTLTCVC